MRKLAMRSRHGGLNGQQVKWVEELGRKGTPLTRETGVPSVVADSALSEIENYVS